MERDGTQVDLFDLRDQTDSWPIYIYRSAAKLEYPWEVKDTDLRLLFIVVWHTTKLEKTSENEKSATLRKVFIDNGHISWILKDMFWSVIPIHPFSLITIVFLSQCFTKFC